MLYLNHPKVKLFPLLHRKLISSCKNNFFFFAYHVKTAIFTNIDTGPVAFMSFEPPVNFLQAKVLALEIFLGNVNQGWQGRGFQNDCSARNCNDSQNFSLEKII